MKPLDDPSDQSLSEALEVSRVLRDAPEHVIERAIALWQPGAARAGRSLLQRVLAAVTFDSALVSPLTQGVRSGAMASRQILYSAQGHDIDLRIVAADAPGRAQASASWVVFGQVLGPGQHGLVELACGDQVRQVQLDAMSEFRFDNVPGGEVRLSLQLGETMIELPKLDVPRPQNP